MVHIPMLQFVLLSDYCCFTCFEACTSICSMVQLEPSDCTLFVRLKFGVGSCGWTSVCFYPFHLNGTDMEWKQKGNNGEKMEEHVSQCVMGVHVITLHSPSDAHSMYVASTAKDGSNKKAVAFVS